MSERYVQPPPPYELSVQHDHKVPGEAQTLAVSKASPLRRGEWNDSKVPTDKTPEVVAVHTPRLDSVSLRARRPLPSRPVDTQPLGPQGQGSKFRPDADTKPYAAQNDHATELRSALPLPFPAIAPSPNDPPYLQEMHHRSTSVGRSPLHYPSQSLCDTPRRKCDNRQLVSTASSTDLRAETSFRRSSRIPFQSPLYPPYPQPQDGNSGTRLLFDPSIAYSDPQANMRTTRPTRRGAAAALYSSAVSSHVPNSTMTYGSRQPCVPARPTLWNTETACQNKTDLRAPSPDSVCTSSPTSLYPSRSKTSGGYEQRWAASESDIARDVYHGG